MDETIKNLLEIQERLIQQTKQDTEAKLVVIKTTQDLITKQEEFIQINTKIELSIQEIKDLLKVLFRSIVKIDAIDSTIDSIDDKLETVITIFQILVSILSSMNNVSKEVVDKLQSHILHLTELSITAPRTMNTFDKLDANKSNITLNG